MLFRKSCTRNLSGIRDAISALRLCGGGIASHQRIWTRYASSTSASVQENIKVTCGGNGFVELSIHNPPCPPASPILIYLPSSPSSPSPSAPFTLPPFLASWNTPIITIHYRWSSTSLFPTPIHDITFAYDWLIKKSRFFPLHGPRRPVGVYGAQLGGSLAMSFGLTESRIGKRGRVSVIATRDAVFDWTPLTQSAPISSFESESMDLMAALKGKKATRKKPKRDKKTNVEDEEAQRLRDAMPDLFRVPEAAFDPFASPLLFLRTPGIYAPSSWDERDGKVAPARSTAYSALRSSDDFDLDSGYDTASDEPHLHPPPVPEANARHTEEMYLGPPPRRSHLRFPPRGRGLVIPNVRIGVSVDEEDPGAWLLRQAEEMSGLLRRSVDVHEGRDRSAYEDVDEGEGESRVAFVGREEGVERDGEWLRDLLGN